MAHLQTASRRFRILLWALIVFVPLLNLLYWASFNHLPDGLIADLPASPMQPLSVASLSLAFLVSLLPVGVALYGLMILESLFKLYEKGIVFSQQNVRFFRRLGYTLLAWVAANALFTPLISVVITFNNPPGSRELVAQFGVLDFSTLVIGAVVLLLSWVMNEGRKLEDEQAHTI